MSNQTKAAGGLSDPGRIKEVLSRHGFHFSKALGQNFLINPTVCPRMAQACGAGDCKGVIEVGPGIGVLTWELSQAAEKGCAIELDSRLFPVLEALQSAATLGINSTIKDKSFNSASATPAIVFPVLLNLAQKHLKKLDTGLRTYHDKQLTALLSKLGEGYPQRLNLPQQGSFQLGYYHQTQVRFEKKEEK